MITRRHFAAGAAPRAVAAGAALRMMPEASGRRVAVIDRRLAASGDVACATAKRARIIGVETGDAVLWRNARATPFLWVMG